MSYTAFGPQGPNYATSRPAADANNSNGADTWFTNCSAPGATDGTYATADWFNVIIDQLRTLVRMAGVQLDNANSHMVYDAVLRVCQGVVPNVDLSGYLPLTGGVVTGLTEFLNNLHLVSSNTAAAGLMFGQKVGGNIVPEWNWFIPTTSGTQDMALARYVNGQYVDSPIVVRNSDGRGLLAHEPIDDMGIVNKSYVDTLVGAIGAPSGGVSLGTPGFVKFPNGLILQWTTMGVNSSSGGTWTFPLAFPHACLGVLSCPIENCGSPDYNTAMVAVSQFNAYGLSIDNNPGFGATTTCILAYGY